MRDDFLASVGVVDEDGPDVTVPKIGELIEVLGKSFRYFEIIYVVSERARAGLANVAAEIARAPNLRIIVTGEGVRFYRQRAIAASEAIGDVVALLDLSDLRQLDLAARLCEAKDTNEILLAWKQASRPITWTYGVFSLLSRNIVTSQAGRTIILPRERLNALFARKTTSLDLRFEPRTAPSRYRRFDIARTARPKGGASRRYELLTEILLSGAPRFLKAYAAAGFVVSLSALLYVFYAIGALLIRTKLQEGWFSTAIVQAGSTAFIATGMSILAIALASVLEAMNGGDDQMIVDEIANITFFDRPTDRNVEVSGGNEAPLRQSETFGAR